MWCAIIRTKMQTKIWNFKFAQNFKCLSIVSQVPSYSYFSAICNPLLTKVLFFFGTILTFYYKKS